MPYMTRGSSYSSSTLSTSSTSTTSSLSNLNTPDYTSQRRYARCRHEQNFTMSHNPFNTGPSQSQQLRLTPEGTGRSSSNRSRSPSGFSLRRSLSGRSQNDSGERQGRASIFTGLFSSSRSHRQQSPPPPYSPSEATDGPIAVSELPASTPQTVLDDQYAFLKEFNTIFLIDDSLSMKAERRWEETQKAISAILPICMEHDEDGVDVYFLNHRTTDRGDSSRGAVGSGYRGVREPRVVHNMFKFVRPSLATPTGLRLDHILRAYLKNYEALVKASGGDVYCVRPINIIVITDGQPTDEPGEVIAQAARRLDEMRAPPHQIGIQFFQVGRDPNATLALRELDDELCRRESIRDMVDTATFNAANKADQPTLTADGILKVVLGAVKRKLDRKVLVRVDGPGN
ncbi:uncharacterized protein GGS22DRAFT_163937 [Annulohypoxylon maeteangense]|uniref:uncharacterized protein n=1 Tax=Annulohypoxylon maeteangense TaxID=1927788 RepID=UPI0020080AB9|nr:uncharacterized protein GGS22DRAFT_163937 [Annulohypoxylon maeteangense]KAI0884618.1 hypothetical protein GGS22DRAFT_163937 [Annulohypoxylon maeteangense]